MNDLAAWILAAMTSLEPSAPWRDTYASTADLFAETATSRPLFAGEDGPKKTAALLVSLAWHEGRLNPRAVGDHGTSVCIFQINETNFGGYGVTRDTLLDDLGACTRVATSILRRSLSVCATRPEEERLAFYAAGSGGCSTLPAAISQSRHRILRAHWLFSHVADSAN